MPDNGEVDIWATIRTNLNELLQVASEGGIIGPRTVLELEADSLVSKSTIYRILDPETVNATTISNLAKLADAYKLHTWQLLVPRLDPRSPPTILTPEQQEEVAVMRVVYQQVQAVARGTDFHTPRAPGSSNSNSPPGSDSGPKPKTRRA